LVKGIPKFLKCPLFCFHGNWWQSLSNQFQFFRLISFH
jgi:hypothetical protein